jgi:hypothetical protein
MGPLLFSRGACPARGAAPPPPLLADRARGRQNYRQFVCKIRRADALADFPETRLCQQLVVRQCVLTHGQGDRESRLPSGTRCALGMI